MTTQDHEIWAYGASSGLTRAQLSVGAIPSGGAWVSLGPPADSALPAVRAAGSTLHRALLGLWMQLEQEAQEQWLLLLTGYRYDAWGSTPDHPCSPTEVRLYPLQGPPSEPLPALSYEHEPAVLALSLDEVFAYRHEVEHGNPAWSSTFGAARRAPAAS